MANVDIIIRMIDQTGAASNKTVSNLKSMAGQFAAVAAVASTIAVAIGKAMDATAKYNAQVRDLALISGESAEESSKFLQVLDDFELTAEDATTAARFLKEKGLVPNIDTLATLADQFKAIQDPAERMAFIQENLGRGGAKWVNVLSQESDALREAAESSNQLLIKTDEQIKKSEIARLQIDKYKDSIEGLKNSIGDFINEQIYNEEVNRRVLEVFKEQGRQVNDQFRQTDEFKNVLAQVSSEMLAEADASIALTESLAEQEAAMKELSESNQDYIDLVAEISDRHADYKDDLDEINQKYSEGKLSTEEYQAALDELAAKQEEASHRMILAMLEQELAADGLTAKETDALIQLGIKWGIYADTAIAEAQRARDEVNTLLGEIQDKTVTVTVQTLGGYDMGTAQYNRIAHAGRASGGGGSGLMQVGENGRELVDLPPGSHVYNNAQTESILGNQKQKVEVKIDESKIGQAAGRAAALAIMGAG